MGLDMYLYLQKYETCSKWNGTENYEKKFKSFYPKELTEFKVDIDKRNFLSKETKYQVGYWRKANAIHEWFVRNCGDDIDECQEIYIGHDDLENLLNTCELVLKDHSKAKELLPTQEGFFFGSQDYDEWYFQDIEYTRDLLKKILDSGLAKTYDVIYQASW